MTTVLCGKDDCIYNEDGECASDIIWIKETGECDIDDDECESGDCDCVAIPSVKQVREKYLKAFDEAIEELEKLSTTTRTNCDYWTVRWCINIVKDKKKKAEADE